MIKLKPGVKLSKPNAPPLSSVWAIALPIIAKAFEPFDTIITAVFEGTHKVDSLHWVGRAIDFRTHHVTVAFARQVVDEVHEALGADFDVVLEFAPPHLHIEYDPKG